MSAISRIKQLLAATAFVAATCLPLSAQTPPKFTPLAEVWQNTSAEYRGICYQTYNMAALQLDNWAPLLQKRADGKAYLPGSHKPVAMIFDLDETIIDNSGFQAFMWRTGAEYSNPIWDAWVDYQGINSGAGSTVPGALEFLAKLDEEGVTPIFISNRRAGFEKQTIKVLRNAGVNMDNIDERVLLKPSGEARTAQEAEAMKVSGIDPDSAEGKRVTTGEGAKEARRLLIRSNYDVLAYFGDVYSDFEPFVMMAESTKRKFEQRRDSLDTNRHKFGKSWFILPNPMYGYWSVGKAIPKDEVKSSLNDYGFEVYLRGRRVIK